MPTFDKQSFGKMSPHQLPSTHIQNLHAHVWEAVFCCIGDSHTAVLTEQGAVYGWGTYRDATGVYGFSPDKRIALLPQLVWKPNHSGDQAVKIASGKTTFFC